MSIVGLERVVYGVEDLALGRRFFTEWGLLPEGDVFRAADGTAVELCAKDDPALPPAIEAGSTARRIVWGVDGRAALDALARRIEGRTAVWRDGDGAVFFSDPAGVAVALVETRRRPLPAVEIAVNTPERRTRFDTVGAFYKEARPRRLGHVVLQVPDIPAAEDFYRGTLGFWLSDRYPGRGVFLRGRAEADHHQLFLLQSPDGAAHFHHLAFEVHDVHEVFGGGLAFAERGWETHIGPGRHVISSCYFWYFRNPCGGSVEYFADMDALTAAWQPREMPQSPEWFAEWALASGIRQYGGVQR
ncbi:MAG TPA: VOC family protein [Stellaceae bacterium]|nr:VOC family protein [Stellaceae bacterium]